MYKKNYHTIHFIVIFTFPNCKSKFTSSWNKNFAGDHADNNKVINKITITEYFNVILSILCLT